MNTKLLKKIMIIVIFIFHITTIIISYANPLFKELNFGEHIFGASTILNLTLLSKINFSFAYFITLILGIVIIVPLSSISNVGKVISNYKELIRMHKMPVSSDEEQIEKTNKIIDFYYDSGISLGSIIAKLLAMVIFTYYAYVIITAGQNYTFLENSNLNFLWFNLNEKDLTLSIIALVLYLINYFYIIYFAKSKKTKIFNAVLFGLFIVGTVYSLFISSTYAVMLITTIIYFRLKELTQLIIKKRKEKPKS